jgi:hypothetical protein
VFKNERKAGEGMKGRKNKEERWNVKEEERDLSVELGFN